MQHITINKPTTDKKQRELNSRLKLAYMGLLLFFIVATLFKLKVIGV